MLAQVEGILWKGAMVMVSKYLGRPAQVRYSKQNVAPPPPQTTKQNFASVVFYVIGIQNQCKAATNLMQEQDEINVYDKIIFLVNVARQLLNILVWFQSIGFAHLDIKWDNILMDENGVVSLIDYEKGQYAPKTPAMLQEDIANQGFGNDCSSAGTALLMLWLPNIDISHSEGITE